MSYFGPRLGFGCDNIANAEVVLASGKIVNANSSSNSDLFTALKGGVNNFGIVTRYDLKTVPDARFWGGLIEYPPQAIPSQLAAFTKFKQQPYDGNAEVENTYTYAQGQLFSGNNLFYTKPVSNPQALKVFSDVQPQLVNTQRFSDIANFSAELASLQASNLR